MATWNFCWKQDIESIRPPFFAINDYFEKDIKTMGHVSFIECGLKLELALST